MWDKIKTFTLTYWVPIRDVLIALAGLLLAKDYFQSGLKAELKTEDTKVKSDDIEEQKTVIGQNIQKLVTDNQAALAQQATESEKLKGMTPEQVQDYYNKKD